ncbi:MAG TPA: RiPP maturation radical SAM C-methyltransferase [Terriglobia bacterium]|nr:RiPP maturation radical SAM C-methyltransferase [Terriglobia bacterium]
MDILFAVLPFADLQHPAIGVSLLSAGLERSGFSSAVRYFNFDLAETIGAPLYEWIAERSDLMLLDTSTPAVSLVGEWFFADLVFPGRLPGEREYLANFLMPEPGARQRIPEILQARRCREAFVDECVREIQRNAPRVVGFTTTFHQTCCCLAVAEALKQTPNPPLIIFGGGNCEGEMGQQMIQSFPWIDFVSTGEGDETVPLFLRRLLREGDARPVAGILQRGQPDLTLPVPVTNLDALPVPDYSGYFERLGRSPFRNQIDPRLLIETARGCWWGEKQHCTFCGLNGQTMAYRSKSPGRVIEELKSLTETYGPKRIDCVDNILDTRYLQTLFPELACNGPEVKLFFETKANLRFEQLRTLREGGVRCVQPGIESFSNEVLRLMRKGCTALQNIQFLRWSDELGLAVIWNVLYGFPDESTSEYARQARVIPLITHLQPPSFCIRVRMDRFSPLYREASRFGLANVRPMPVYGYVFPLPSEDLARLAYFFEFDYADGRRPADYAGELVREIAAWSEASNAAPPQLNLFEAGSLALVNDTRPCAVNPTHVLSGLEAKVCLLCDTAHTVPGLLRQLGGEASELEVRRALARLEQDKLVLEMERQYLSLPVFRNRTPSVAVPGRLAIQEPAVASLI